MHSNEGDHQYADRAACDIVNWNRKYDGVLRAASLSQANVNPLVSRRQLH